MMMEINAKITVFIFIVNSVISDIDGMKNWPSAKFNNVFASRDMGTRKMNNFCMVIMFSIVVVTQATLTSLIVPSLNNHDISSVFELGS